LSSGYENRFMFEDGANPRDSDSEIPIWGGIKLALLSSTMGLVVMNLEVLFYSLKSEMNGRDTICMYTLCRLAFKASYQRQRPLWA
jgi:hypothetical protein